MLEETIRSEICECILKFPEMLWTYKQMYPDIYASLVKSGKIKETWLKRKSYIETETTPLLLEQHSDAL